MDKPETEKTSILIVDDHRLLCDAIEQAIAGEQDFEIHTAGSLVEADQIVAQHKIDIMLLDVRLPEMIPLRDITAMIERLAGTSIMIFSGNEDEFLARQAVQKGAAGFFPKTLPLKILPAAIRLVRSGGVFMPLIRGNGGMIKDGGLSEERSRTKLTERELSILRFIQAGMTNKEIARELESTEVRVKMYLRAIFEKLNAKNRAHSVTIAQSLGLIAEGHTQRAVVNG